MHPDHYSGRVFGASPKVDLWRHTIVTKLWLPLGNFLLTSLAVYFMHYSSAKRSQAARSFCNQVLRNANFEPWVLKFHNSFFSNQCTNLFLNFYSKDLYFMKFFLDFRIAKPSFFVCFVNVFEYCRRLSVDIVLKPRRWYAMRHITYDREWSLWEE